MDMMFPKAGFVRPFELGVRRLHTPDLLQTYKAHLSDVHGIKRFSLKSTEKATRISFEKPQFRCETNYVCQVYTLLGYSAFLWPVYKITLGIVLNNSFKLPLY